MKTTEFVMIMTLANCYHNTDALKYVVYYPKPYDTSNPTGYKYSQCSLPIYINVHGGGFSDCRDNDENAGDNVLCTEMAKRGFVVFNVNYRLGVILARPSPVVSAQQQLGIYRANQDIRGGIRSIVRIQQDQNNHIAGAPVTDYQINTNHIFLGGNSAGSITVLNVAYYPTQAKVNAVNPNSGTTTIANALGNIEANFYYGGTDIEYRSGIEGVLNQWGNVTIPPAYYDANNLTKAKDFFDVRIPVISFHGLQDKTVYPNVRPLYFATTADNNFNVSPPRIVNSESNCLKANVASFQTVESPGVIDLYTYGSIAFFNYVLQPLDIPSESYTDCSMMHGLDKMDGATFHSDFGTCYHTAAEVSRYIAARAAVFFQNIISKNAQARQDTASVHKVFTDCRNYHKECDLLNADPGCTTELTCPSPTDQCTP